MTQPRWLSAQEQEVWRAFVAMRAVLDDVLDRELQRDVGMPHAYFQILVMLSEADGARLRVADLAAGLHGSHSRVSHAVTAMERNGWVARTPCDTDKRVTFVELTVDGRRILERAAPGHVEAVRATIFDALSATDLAALHELSTRILAASLQRMKP